MGKGSKPKVPDPVQTAEAQATYNKEAAEHSAGLNQVTQQSPYGSTYWTGEIGTPDRTQHTTLSPALQQQLNSRNSIQNSLLDIGSGRGISDRQWHGSRDGGGLTGQVADAWRNPLSFDGLNPVRNPDLDDLPGVRNPDRVAGDMRNAGPVTLDGRREGGGLNFSGLPELGLQAADRARDPNQLLSGVEDSRSDTEGLFGLANPDSFGDESERISKSVYDRAMAQLRPELDRQQSRLDLDIMNRGLPETSEASTGMRNRFADSRARQLTDTSLASVLAGSGEHERLARLAERGRAQQFGERNRMFDESLGTFGAGQDANRFYEDSRQADFGRRAGARQIYGDERRSVAGHAEGQRQADMADILARGQFAAGQNQDMFGRDYASRQFEAGQKSGHVYPAISRRVSNSAAKANGNSTAISAFGSKERRK